MDNHQLIHFVYQSLLRREPGDPTFNYYSEALDSGRMTRETFILEIMGCEEFQSSLKVKELFPIGHFYSPIPSPETRVAASEAYWDRYNQTREIPGVDLNRKAQTRLLESFLPYYADQPFKPQKQDGLRYYFENEAYCYTDALFLHFMMRHFKPKRIIEIGSGFSSCVMLDTNEKFLHGQTQITFIEPYPKLLLSLIREEDKKCRILDTTLQSVDLTVFDQLEENDILFVDSTHVSKLDSDVNRAFFDIFPRLKKGVLVHIHDIFWPFEYPQEWIQQGRSWNELYMLRAFLQYNRAFSIQLFAHYLHRFHGTWIEKHMPLMRQNRGGCVWLRKEV